MHEWALRRVRYAHTALPPCWPGPKPHPVAPQNFNW